MNLSLILHGRDDNTRLSQSVYETLLEAILAGQLAPGDVISEVKLAQQLEVSRTPVHEAIRELAKDGLVVQHANRRPVISSFSREDVFDVFEMRILLESEAARKAAQKVDRPTLARLRTTAEELAADREAPNWLNRWADFDEDFHDAIAKASGSPRLLHDINRYRLLHRGFNKLRTSVEVLGQALQEHFDILDKLDQRDTAGAHAAMALHIKEWQAFFVQNFNGSC
ncbi:GntR family transcriptional regulator [Lignipirellula cremea]|uniref:Putative HTH-type transcriptional regulator YdfH n=1 Tax=Lignipirellula cremea TaxID=2528010 RepID=A0A518DMI3_9BACT|nr:GntR family transcriptional regulator [Lignipirellula cremea]QDU93048.1 putative HTH-type transcriptional regulator YdfH [Lignipirellula cremea]